MLSLLSKQEKIQAIERFESKYIKYSDNLQDSIDAGRPYGLRIVLNNS